RQDDERRLRAVAGQGVALVDLQLLRSLDERAYRELDLELALERRLEAHPCDAIAVVKAAELTMPVPPGGERVLSDEALAFLAGLHREFDPRRRELLALRRERQERLEAGELPDFLEETRSVRENPDWRVALAPRDLRDRRAEITRPGGREVGIHRLSSRAQVVTAGVADR